ncbi:MAG TPA: bifunctional hydroxymethylpyrimidine kinase/phosphomethylpyrimidine kinase [Pyrinomonadaceae bacterium]|nr:bifunctional hydroxymethylpyrimidine kinase/phosphomethylpyrimidine kinase [Pyrinomonadaceae bacterium]
MPRVLTIAGLDPSGGAGVIVDIRTINAFHCAPVAAITAITFQNHQAVYGVEPMSAEIISNQVNAVLAVQAVDGVKVGMLPTIDSVREVTRLCSEGRLPQPVLDPVLQSTSGYALIEDEAIPALVSELFPLARLVTPNIAEAEKLTGLRITDLASVREAATAIRRLGAEAVLIKGGHLEGFSEAIDLLDDGNEMIFRANWIPNANCRGTGCMLSSAIAACLAHGKSLGESVAAAKEYVFAEIMTVARAGASAQ